MRILLVSLFFSLFTFSQNTNKPVEFITSNNEKLTGFINTDKIYDVTYFEFTEDLNQPTKSISINTIKEFTINGTEKYLVQEILIDKNRSHDLQNYGDSEVKLVKKTVVIREIVKGEYNLFMSYQQNTLYFFYNSNSNPNITYLIYNETNNEGLLKKNMQYVGQLRYLFKDNTLDERLRYSKSDLVNLFVKKNGGDSKDLTKKDYKGRLQYKVFAGVKNYNIRFEYEEYFGKKFTDTKTIPTVGAELIYNYSKKFDIFTRASFDNLGDVRINKNTQAPASSTMIYEDFIYEAKYLNFNLGSRYYVSVKKNRLFVDLSLEYTKNINSKLLTISSVNNTNPDMNDYTSLVSNDNISLNMGIGYEINQKYGLEFRYSTGKQFYNKNTIIDSNFSNINFNLYYKLN